MAAAGPTTAQGQPLGCPSVPAHPHRSLQAGERYVEEWLRQQAAARVIQTDEAAQKFWLTAAQQVGRAAKPAPARGALKRDAALPLRPGAAACSRLRAAHRLDAPLHCTPPTQLRSGSPAGVPGE